MISVNKINELNGTTIIYIKLGSVTTTVVEKGIHNCYISIRLIFQNTNILTKLNKQRVLTLHIIIIVLLLALIFITTLFVVFN